MMGCQGMSWRKMIRSCVGWLRWVLIHCGENTSSNVCAIMVGTSVGGVDQHQLRHDLTH